MQLRICVDTLDGAEIADFLSQHIDDMRSVSPPESKHALDLEALRAPDITFWSAYLGSQLVGCGALKALSSTQGEVKSMRTDPKVRGRGVGRQILTTVVSTARQRGYRAIYLETGAMEFFEPARRLYASFGFERCAPFADYSEDPNSVFYRYVLADG